MMGLGILDTDLCMWASTATPEMVENSLQIVAHPVVKAKPNSILGPAPDAGWFERIDCWVDDNPLLAAAIVVGGYLLVRKK